MRTITCGSSFRLKGSDEIDSEYIMGPFHERPQATFQVGHITILALTE